MEYIKISEACKLLNRSMNGVRLIVEKYSIRTIKHQLRKRQVILINKNDCENVLPLLKPRKFARYHNNKPVLEKRTGYVKIYKPEHHRAMCDGYIYEHWLIAEQILGRPLLKTEHVHHKDRVRNNNNPDNIHVFSSRSEHMKQCHSELREFLKAPILSK